ncbi:ATP-grasp domain-containing protein [Xylophilus sp. GW821-FHT01B05]
MVSVLVFPCGSEIGLEIGRSLRHVEDVHLVGASSVDDHGRFAFDHYVGGLPSVEDEDFPERLADLAKALAIDFIFPAHDSVVLALSRCAEKFEAEILTSALLTCEVTRSKRQTYEYLGGVLRTPRVYAERSGLPYPVFLKPDVGQGSKGTLTAFSDADVAGAFQRDGSLLVLEYLPGPEYTVDCFTDRSGVLRYAMPRVRRRIAGGISVNSSKVDLPEAADLAHVINHALELRGAWFFQLKISSDGEPCLLEVAPRIAGTMAVSRAAGVNLPWLTLMDRLGREVQVRAHPFHVEVDRALGTRYRLGFEFEHVYIDLEPGLLICQQPSPEAMLYLHRCRNQSKKTYLVTRGLPQEAVARQLQRAGIALTLFSEILALGQEEALAPEPNAVVISGQAQLVRFKDGSVCVFHPHDLECLL